MKFPGCTPNRLSTAAPVGFIVLTHHPPTTAAPEPIPDPPTRFVLEWDAPPTCPSADEVHALVARSPTVLELVKHHEREYPEGLLKSEREALRSLALCTLRHPDAQATYTAFTREHPNSTHLKRVRARCSDLEK